MKQFFKNRVLPFVISFSVIVSLAAPVFAAFESGFADPGSVAEWEAKINNPATNVINAVGSAFGVESTASSTFWALVDNVVSPYVGSVSLGELESLCSSFDSVFNRPMGENIFSHLIGGTQEIYADSLAYLYLGTLNLKFEVQEHPSSGFQRIKETTTNTWVVTSTGAYPYAVVESDGETEAGDQWIGETTAGDRAKSGSVALQTLDRLNLMCVKLKEVGIAVQLKTLNGSDGTAKYYGIWYNRQFYADPSGNPYVAQYDNNSWASNQDRVDTGVVDENGETVEGLPEENTTNIDLSGMTITLPDGSINLIDQIIYDESTKSYHIDSHDTYNVTNNYYYEWNYYINYTSITYIGQTEEYNKYYEVYYELPDGRDSADLTKEEVEQLNVSVDVIPYGRSADDTSLRSLYHFDGDTRDSSYWNYCTEFIWNDGASLTYMDSGVFEGALYLDETEHDFTIALPSRIGTGDFTLQFRYYQSYTAAPVEDSYIDFGGASVPLLCMNGAMFWGVNKTAIPIGTWNEIAIIRSDGYVDFYLNGLSLGGCAFSETLGNEITFHFGDEQQTYKYLDELRVLDRALTEPGEDYTPTSVPHDTNLALVLPDSAVPVADEYWDIKFADNTVYTYDFSEVSSVDSSVFVQSTLAPGNYMNAYATFPQWMYCKNGMSLGTTGVMVQELYTDLYVGSSYFPTSQQYTFSVLLADGSVCDLTFTPGVSASASGNGITLYSHVYGSGESIVRIYAPSFAEIIALAFAPGTESAVSGEWVESITAIEKDDLNTPTLAVRTDLEITSYQIGGVRPSIPTKGQVWAMVENERITSIQIYNGQAWEGVDGRIWTGERWVPASSYNIVTLQDMYDIVDATQDYEYIYTESGFWAWWQKSWNAFTEKLFSLLGSGGSGGTSSASGTVKEAVSNALSSLIEGIFGVITEVLKSLIGAAKDLLSGIFSFFTDTVFGGISDFFSSLGELVNPFESTVENEDGTTTTTTELPEGIAAVFAFFSGAFLVMPAELRMIAMFGIGLMLLLAVFKKVSA